MFRAALTRWLQAPPVTGWMALVFALAALWIPTIIRLSFIAALLLTGPAMILFYVLAGLLAPAQ